MRLLLSQMLGKLLNVRLSTLSVVVFGGLSIDYSFYSFFPFVLKAKRNDTQYDIVHYLSYNYSNGVYSI